MNMDGGMARTLAQNYCKGNKILYVHLQNHPVFEGRVDFETLKQRLW